MMASMAMAIKDSKICLSNKKTGVIITHENPGLEGLLTKMISESYKILKGENGEKRNKLKHQKTS